MSVTADSPVSLTYGAQYCRQGCPGGRLGVLQDPLGAGGERVDGEAQRPEVRIESCQGGVQVLA